MKTTRLCPKCNSNDIVRIDGYTGAYGCGYTAFQKGKAPYEHFN